MLWSIIVAVCRIATEACELTVSKPKRIYFPRYIRLIKITNLKPFCYVEITLFILTIMGLRLVYELVLQTQNFIRASV